MMIATAPSIATQNLSTAKASGPLTQIEECRLARRWHRYGDRAAIETLVRAHLGLVVKIAHEFRSSLLPFDDLVQEGNVGLTIAARRFDPTRATRLSTYASYWIRACIMEHVVCSHGPVRIGTTRAQRRIYFNVGRARQRIESRGDEVTADLLASELGVEVNDLEAMAPRIQLSDISLDEERHMISLSRSISLKHEAHTPEEQCTRREEEVLRYTHIARALRKLEPREREIITSRHLRERPETLAEIGRRFGLSRERIRQIESRAKQRIRQLCGESTTFLRTRRGKAR